MGTTTMPGEGSLETRRSHRKRFQSENIWNTVDLSQRNKYTKVVRDVRKLPKHLIGRYQAPGVPSNPARDVMVAEIVKVLDLRFKLWVFPRINYPPPPPSPSPSKFDKTLQDS